MKKIISLLAVLVVSGLVTTGAYTSADAQSRVTPEDRQAVPAPIESIDVVPNGSAPTGHALKVVAGLPNGCAQPYDSGSMRYGDFIFAYVLNSVPASDDVACTMVYGTYEVTIDLGNDFVPGKEYTAFVNGQMITFTAHGGVVPPDDRVSVPAPIESVDIVSTDSFPSQYTAHIVAGLPSGCAEPEDYEVSREGNRITIDVTNTMPEGDPICTSIYRTYPLYVDLGSDFVSGETYIVDVNGTIEKFTAR